MRNRSWTQPPVERLIALGYGLTYDAVVRGFPPYEALLAEVAGLVARAATPGPPAATRVLDVSCGTGTLAARLAREGWTVVGVDSVAHLVEVGRRRHCDSGLSLSFHHADAARDPIPGSGTYDVLVSMHTLYWRPHPGHVLGGPAAARLVEGLPVAALAGAHGPLRAVPARHASLPQSGRVPG